MNIPFLLMAQLTGRLDRRVRAATVICAGCLAAAAGLLALSLASPSTPFLLTVIGYVLAGAGFGTLVPAITHVAMRDVPAGASGAASGVLNASRQIGTSVGLAVLGSIGVSAAVADWTAQTGHFPAAVRAAARGQAQQVAGARIAAVTRTLGAAYRQPAVQSFGHGYHLAIGTGAACLLLAALIAVTGFRGQPTAPPAALPPSRQPQRVR
jgi:MFS transporter, DHA2 family, methylenomycin A resistance protein